jgi:ABC-2 type transport system permease protein
MPEPTAPEAVLPGFSELLRKELLEARRSKRAIAFVLIMTFIVVLVPVIAYFQADDFGGGSRHLISDDDMEGAVGAWAGLVAYIGSLMVIASTVDAMTRERSLGITAWIVTKPVSRLSYLLAKAVGHTLISAVTVVVIPSIVWLVLMLAMFEEVPVGYALWGALFLLIEVVFLSFCVIAIGVPLNAVVWIALVSLGFWFIPTAAPAVSTLDWTYRVLPSYLPVAAIAATLPESAFDSEVFTITIAALAVMVITFLGAALLFERQEL